MNLTRLGGTVKLRSSNPFDKVIINPQYLTTDFDVFTMRESVKAVKSFVSAKAWSDYIIAPFGELANANTDAEIDQFVRDTTTTIFHPTGTAAMSSTNSKTGVVNPDLTVKGADGLRIVDASAFVSTILSCCVSSYQLMACITAIRPQWSHPRAHLPFC